MLELNSTLTQEPYHAFLYALQIPHEGYFSIEDEGEEELLFMYNGHEGTMENYMWKNWLSVDPQQALHGCCLHLAIGG